ncbi:MAG: substrate-binding domain-containing protein [Bryobacterales bacterium]|nr:substrate-binding domain-containing protein [Bryobacterales bacterium]
MRNRLPAALAAVAILALGGCQRDRQRVVGVVPKATSHVFWQSVQAGALAAGQEFDVRIEWNGPPSETEFSRQIQIVDSLVARRVDGLAVAAADRTALVGPVERATKAGIPVTVFDSGLDTEDYVCFVATNNYEGGRMAARKLAALLGGKGEVAVLMHAPGSASTLEREKGFRDALAAEFPGLRIVAEQFGMSDRAKARAAAENMLAAHPELDGLFASAEPSSVGAALAVKGRELAGKVQVVAFDASEGLVEDLRAGTIQALVVQDPFRIGYEAVRTLVRTWEGNPPPKRVDLDAVVVLSGDLEKPDIRQLLFPDLKSYLR